MHYNTERLAFPLVGSEGFVKKITTFSHQIKASTSPIHITGETGTGKSLIAQHIFQTFTLYNKKLVTIPLSEIAPDLFESQLFGHRRGAFTGAIEDFVGLIKAANGGTVLLEEIDCLPLHIQPKILRLIESQKFIAVGARETQHSDVRFITTSNQCLEELVNNYKFRKDLYYRLSTISLRLESLKMRKNDIIPLMLHFSQYFAHQLNQRKLTFSDEYISIFKQYSWPGNIRELKSEIERLYTFAERELRVALPEHISTRILSQLVEKKEDNPSIFDELKSENGRRERQLILGVLRKYDHNKTKTSQELGISRKHLYALMRKHNISIK